VIIRSQQMEVFDRQSFRNFENEAIAHAREFAPKHCEVLGEDATRAAVKAGIERAGEHGFTSRGPVHLFLDLMFLLGGEFDTDPQYPWAAGILGDQAVPGQAERADRLHTRSIEYLEKVYGPENRFLIAALGSIGRTVEDLERRPQRAVPSTVRAVLHAVHPEKSAELNDAGLNAILQDAASVAQACSITSEAGIGLLILLAFAFGHAFARDPLYPWIRATLEAQTPPSGNERARLLQRKTLAYLGNVRSYLEAG
jgi:hypothetical protein